MRETSKKSWNEPKSGGKSTRMPSAKSSAVIGASGAKECSGPEKISLTVKLKAISLNKAYPTGHSGRRYLCEEGAAFKKSVYYQVLNKIPWRADKDDRFAVEIDFCFKDRRRRDIDDYFKLLLDALTDAVVWLDDSQIIKLTGRKEQGRENSITINISKVCTNPR